MPLANEYTVNKDTDKAAEEELAARVRVFTRNERYFRGDQPPPLKTGMGEPNDNVVMNVTKIRTERVVDLVSAAGFPQGQINPEGSGLDEQIKATYDKAGGDNWLKQAVETGAMNGQSFVKVVLPDASNGEVYPRLVLLTNIIKWVQEDDLSNVLWYEQRWTVGRTTYKQDTVNRGGHWEIYEYQREGQEWRLIKEVMQWEYPVAPIVDVQHLPNSRSIYGRNEYDNLPLQDSINKIASEINRILRFHAYPRTVGTGFQAGEVQKTAIDQFWVINNENATIKNLEMQSDLSASREHLKVLTQQYYSEAGLFYDDTPTSENKTATAVIREHEPQLNKQRTLRQQYATLIEGIDRVLGYVFGAGEITSKRIWGTSPLEATLNLYRLDFALKNELISKETAAKELGYNYALEIERMTNEALTRGILVDGAMVGVSG